MTTITDIFNTFAPEYLERSPHLPTSHRKVISAIQNCRSGHYGHSLYQCQRCGGHHRVNHSCGNRHCPQCQHHKTPQWLHQQLANQLPGPHFLITFTIPETLRPVIRSHQHLAYQAMLKAQGITSKCLELVELNGSYPCRLLHVLRPFVYLPNARPELLPEAGATQERTLEAVSSRLLFGVGRMGRAWRFPVCPMALECLPQYREAAVTPRRVS